MEISPTHISANQIRDSTSKDESGSQSLANPMNHTANTRAATSDYREYAPPPGLADHFLCFWTQSITGCGEYAQRVLPDGCIDIVFMNDESPVVVGPWVQPFIARLPGTTNILGARWHPGRAPALLGAPATELLNQQVALRDVCSRKLSSSLERVSEQPNLDARRSALECALLKLLACVAPSDRILNASLQWLAHHPDGRIEKLSRFIGFSSRQLQRRFSASVGYGPKAFQSIVRFQRLLHLAGCASRRRSLVELAACVGYADQAHMTREVQRLSDCPPTVLFESSRCALQMSDFFQDSHE
jgi:AraC-like DNA-binding protein